MIVSMCECASERASGRHPREQWVRAGVGARVQMREGIQRNNHIPLPWVPSCWPDPFPGESRPHWPRPYYLSHAPRDEVLTR